MFHPKPYLTIPLDMAGLSRFLAFWVPTKNGSSGEERRLYFCFILCCRDCNIPRSSSCFTGGVTLQVQSTSRGGIRSSRRQMGCHLRVYPFDRKAWGTGRYERAGICLVLRLGLNRSRWRQQPSHHRWPRPPVFLSHIFLGSYAGSRSASPQVISLQNSQQ